MISFEYTEGANFGSWFGLCTVAEDEWGDLNPEILKVSSSSLSSRHQAADKTCYLN